MLVLSGDRISDLERTGQVLSSDEFLLSRRYNPDSPRMFSKRVSYCQVEEDILDTLSSSLNLSSMAYEDTVDYARKNHGHDYSNVTIWTRYPHEGRGMTPLVELSARNSGKWKVLKICAPVQKYDSKEDPIRIGEVRFMALPQLREIDVNAEDFDGWVWPDGAEYSRWDFPEAFAVYGKSEADQTFRVPAISELMRLNPGIELADPMKFVKYENGYLPAHSHEVDKDVLRQNKVKVSINIDIPCTQDCSYNSQLDECLHGPGYANTDLGANHMIFDGEYRVTSLECTLTASGGQFQTVGDDHETHPSYNFLPVQVYIGRKG